MSMATVMKSAQNRLYNQQADEIWTRIHSVGTKVRITNKILRLLLLNHGDCSMMNGYGIELKKRSLGAGVYEIWMEYKK